MQKISQNRAVQPVVAETRFTDRKTLGAFISGLYADSPWLTVTGFMMLADTAISLLGLAFDPTTITGAPAWMKPLKFALSVLLFSPTVAWMIGRLHKTRRFASILGKALAVALVAEIALIDMQAARHTTSHFNRTTQFDAAVFGAMGIFIAILYLSTALLFLAACIERFSDRSQGWAIRLGLFLALAGMGTGVLMTLPTPQQLAEAHQTGALTHSGAHTVGGPDGGPSLPVTGWSVDHGDLRIAHFLGLHAMQALLLAWWFTRRRASWPQPRQIRLVTAVGISVALAFGLTLWQALRGQPFLKPDSLTLSGWAAWLAALLICVTWIALSGNTTATPQLEKTR